MARKEPKTIADLMRLESEGHFQSRLLDLAAFYGWTLGYHTHDSRRSPSGWPDLVLGHEQWRLTLFVELKTEDGKVSPAQQRWIDQLQRSGHFARVWRPSDWPEIEAVLAGSQRALERYSTAIPDDWRTKA